jgi:hypothetical protein
MQDRRVVAEAADAVPDDRAAAHREQRSVARSGDVDALVQAPRAGPDRRAAGHREGEAAAAQHLARGGRERPGAGALRGRQTRLDPALPSADRLDLAHGPRVGLGDHQALLREPTYGAALAAGCRLIG